MWTVTVNKDEDKPDVGTVTATYTEEDGTVFSWTARGKNTPEQIQLFVERSIQLLALAREKRAIEVEVAAAIKALLDEATGE